MQQATFAELGLSSSILENLTQRGYSTPTPIQTQAIPEALLGKDLLATAQTGTGKTASFVLPIIEHILLHSAQSTKNSSHRGAPKSAIKALILTPTRELAEQIHNNIREYANNTSIHSTAVVGGVAFFSQERALRRGPAILVATPGRLIDLMGQGKVDLSKVEMLVLDEADRMLDMGFSEDVAEITSQIPEERQTLLFSATMAKGVMRLAENILRDPVRIDIAPCASLAKNLKQEFHFLRREDKQEALLQLIQSLGTKSRILVFSRTKHQANLLEDLLNDARIRSEAIHSDKSQGARRRSLKAFDQGRVQVLIGTDVVSRGIDVKEIDVVLNYDLPEDPEVYVHRIGRTARAQTEGLAISFCTHSDAMLLRGIQQLTKIEIQPEIESEYFSEKIWKSIQSALSKEKGDSRRTSSTRSNTRSSRGRRANSFQGRGRRQQRSDSRERRGGRSFERREDSRSENSPSRTSRKTDWDRREKSSDRSQPAYSKARQDRHSTRSDAAGTRKPDYRKEGSQDRRRSDRTGPAERTNRASNGSEPRKHNRSNFRRNDNRSTPRGGRRSSTEGHGRPSRQAV